MNLNLMMMRCKIEEDLERDSQGDGETDEIIKDLFPIYCDLTQKGVEMEHQTL